MYKAYRPIIEAHKKLNQTTEEWHRQEKPAINKESVNKVVNGRGAVSAASLALIGYAFNVSNTEIVKMLETYAKEYDSQAPECKAFMELIAPVDITKDEREMIQKVRKLDDTKRKLVLDMIKTL